MFIKNLVFGFALFAILLVTISATNFDSKTVLTENFIKGDLTASSISELAFGPEGILFMGDAEGAMIFALDTQDKIAKNAPNEINLAEFDKKIASSLGTSVENIKINDMAVNPISKNIYFSVNVTDGTPVVLKLNGDRLEHVSLKDVSYSKIDLQDPVEAEAEDRRGRSLRVWAISDLKYHNGQVLVSGLSNKEFGSTFRSIPFPFNDTQDYASLEIYHAAHGQYETNSPIKTFDVITMNGEEFLVASYTCTPLVLFPMNKLKNGTHTKGRTVAELGSGNSPLDMISLEKEGKQYFIMSNSNRPVMKIAYEDIRTNEEALTEPVEEFGVAKGLNYISLPMVHITQLDNLDDTNVVYLQRTADGELILRSRSTQWM